MLHNWRKFLSFYFVSKYTFCVITIVSLLKHVIVDIVKCCVCVVDVLHAVNDGSLSWMQRVKLLRYAWISEDVMLVNKKQTLMNFLMSAVSVTQRYSVCRQTWL